MKKLQRSFVVEHKSGRRRTESKSNSIWGDMDLKSIAQDVQEEAMLFPPVGFQVGKPGGELSLPERGQPGVLTLPARQRTTEAALQETIMADERDTTIVADAPAVTAPATIKKQRKPRAKKVAVETRSAEVAAEPADAAKTAAGKPKRGRRVKADDVVNSAKRGRIKRTPKAVQIESAPITGVIDEMADLLQLEEENRGLRKLLAEKLRAENAELRKRLNLV
ncbi:MULTISPECIES: transcriptional regulator [Rhizobium]|uniref:Transcriptional regulator n=1 Tax=Rhizobium anhuiense TaxID=1184720 RepID=A0A3S0QET6_9HYPH|nr:MULTISPECIES: transcriptional regulator [Rhizobium]MBB3742077.1 hypothetical protein [Rhizobium sp. BK591]MBB4251896.1 hypothetical protein [Rhizobium sp. BK008]NKM59370.1 transcriptional regulator [Rhizobium anhuiense]PDS38437.1 transcriptional regulator [Rhizobium anhuiense]PDS40803.1 transcriptional regulator [Rhizobium anhuiense]